MEDKLVSVGKFDEYMQAEMAKQILEDYGIKAVVTGANASNVYSAMPFVERPEVMVMSNRAEEAKEILARYTGLSESIIGNMTQPFFEEEVYKNDLQILINSTFDEGFIENWFNANDLVLTGPSFFE